jgi:hypothetical protein
LLLLILLEIQSSIPNYFNYNDGLKMKDHIRKDVMDDFSDLLGGI